MTNEQVCKNFAGGKEGRSLNMLSTGDRLYSYNTVIAQWIDGKIILNGTKYSPTTSRHTYYIRSHSDMTTSEYVPINSQDLRPYL